MFSFVPLIVSPEFSCFFLPFWVGLFHIGASLMAQRVKRLPAMWETRVWSLGQEGFPGGASGKEPACQCKRCKTCGFDPWVRKIPWRRAGNPLQYSCLENPMERGAWRATVHWVAQSQTWLKWLSTHVSHRRLPPNVQRWLAVCSHMGNVLKVWWVT